ncbi:hypothetical protein MRB53_042140 [Persea americana]|nr:hypothetical protein MRB53_042140 [Persea americana]
MSPNTTATNCIIARSSLSNTSSRPRKRGNRYSSLRSMMKGGKDTWTSCLFLKAPTSSAIITSICWQTVLVHMHLSCSRSKPATHESSGRLPPGRLESKALQQHRRSDAACLQRCFARAPPTTRHGLHPKPRRDKFRFRWILGSKGTDELLQPRPSASTRGSRGPRALLLAGRPGGLHVVGPRTLPDSLRAVQEQSAIGLERAALVAGAGAAEWIVAWRSMLGSRYAVELIGLCKIAAATCANLERPSRCRQSRLSLECHDAV